MKWQKNSYRDLTPFSIPPKYVDHKNMNEKNIPRWLFELPPKSRAYPATSGWRLIEARFEWTQLALWGDESRVFCG